MFSISRTDGIDIRNTQQVDSFLQNLSKIDFLINVAAINSTNKIDDISVEEWDDVISTNLSSIFYITKKNLKLMKSGSRIVNFRQLQEEIEVW